MPSFKLRNRVLCTENNKIYELQRLDRLYTVQIHLTMLSLNPLASGIFFSISMEYRSNVVLYSLMKAKGRVGRTYLR